MGIKLLNACKKMTVALYHMITNQILILLSASIPSTKNKGSGDLAMIATKTHRAASMGQGSYIFNQGCFLHYANLPQKN